MKTSLSPLRATALVLTGLAWSAAASAQDDALKEAGRIGGQPLKDVGVTRPKIPAVLQTASSNPYAGGRAKCTAIRAELGRLNEALGPDFSRNPAENQDRAADLARAGGRAVVNSLVPFRALVREISGAAPADRRLRDAVEAGFARRGYLRGVAQIRGCKIG